jgi:hypothetical protein
LGSYLCYAAVAGGQAPPPWASELNGRSRGGTAGKGRSKPSGVSGPGGGPGSRRRKTEWPEGTVMGWCKCGAKGKKGNKHDKPMQQGVRGRQCGYFSLSAPPG